MKNIKLESKMKHLDQFDAQSIIILNLKPCINLETSVSFYQ